MAVKHVERYTPSLIMMDIWTKTTQRYHNTLCRVTKISYNTESFKYRATNRVIIYCRNEYKMVQSLWKTFGNYLKS